MAKPLVSVILSRRSGERQFSEALDSLHSQTFNSFEIIPLEFKKSSSAALNQGVAECQGEYVAFLDSNHVWAPHKLEKQIVKLRAHSVMNWCYCDAIGYQSFRMPRFSSGDIWRSLLLSPFIPPSSVVVRRSALIEAGGFNESPAYIGSEDWDLWLRLAVGNAIGFVNEKMVYIPHEDLPDEQLCESRKRVVEAAIKRDHILLQDFRSDALTEVCLWAGNAYLRANQRSEARQKFAEALKYTPLRSDVYLSWLSSFLPSAAQNQTRDLTNLATQNQSAQPAIGVAAGELSARQ